MENIKFKKRVKLMRRAYKVQKGRNVLSRIFSVKDFCPCEVLYPALKRVLVASAIFISCLYVNSLSQAWLQGNLADYYQMYWPPNATLVKEKRMSLSDTVQLWDLGFRIGVKLPTKYADMFAGALPTMFFFRFFVCPGPYSMRWTILCRMLICWGLLWFLRAITILVTPLPNPDHTCKPIISFPDNVWREALAITPFDVWHSDLTCQDVMFSGHTVCITVSVMLYFKVVQYAPWSECLVLNDNVLSGVTVVNIIGCLIMLAGYSCIVLSQFHYTLDVLVGILMTFFVVHGYHAAIHLAMLSPHDRNVFFRFLRWLEQDAKDLRMSRVMLRHCLRQINDDEYDEILRNDTDSTSDGEDEGTGQQERDGSENTDPLLGSASNSRSSARHHV